MNADLPVQGWHLRSVVGDDAVLRLSLALETVPELRADDVLVRVEAAPVNPSDLGVMFAGADVSQAVTGGTGVSRTMQVPMPKGAARAAASRVGQPMPVGNEGAGTVVAAGRGPAAQGLLGRTVSAVGSGLYAQYRALPASAVIALPGGVRAEQAAAGFVNPMTALGMLETMRLESHEALVHTAAASALGQMLVRLCAADGVQLVNVVRSPAQVALLREAGAEHVVDSTSESFRTDLKNAVAATGATLCFDAVGGGLVASQVLSAMESALSAGSAHRTYGSVQHKQVYVYGGLDPSPTQLNRGYGMAWGVGGWLVSALLARVGPQRAAQLRARVADSITSTFATRFTDTLSLPDLLQADAAHGYSRPTTGRKYLVAPHAGTTSTGHDDEPDDALERT